MNTKLHEALLAQLEMTRGQNVVFWGASLFLKEFLEKYPTKQYNIKGIVDNNSFKWGSTFCEYPILPPQKLKTLEPVSIIFTIKNSNRKIYKDVLNLVDHFSYSQISLLPNIFRNENFCNNEIYIIKDNIRRKTDYIPGLTICFLGNNNTIEIDENTVSHFFDCKLILESNNHISIDSSKYVFQSVVFRCKKNTELIIGKNCSICSGHFCIDDNLKIQIGEDCMFSAQIYVRAGDGHTIYDINTNEIINNPEKECITIGNHVWIGNSACILKNTKIADNTIIARGATVTKKFEEPNVILAGSPAKIIKTGVNWSRKSIEAFKLEPDFIA